MAARAYRRGPSHSQASERMHACLHAAAPPPGGQQDALILLKGVMDPSASLLQSWDPTVAVCAWAGVTCNTQGQVTNMCVQTSRYFSWSHHLRRG